MIAFIAGFVVGFAAAIALGVAIRYITARRRAALGSIIRPASQRPSIVKERHRP